MWFGALAPERRIDAFDSQRRLRGFCVDMGSRGCHFRFFSDCRGAYPDAGVAFELNFTEDTWRSMSNCSFDDYPKFKKFESPFTADCDISEHGASTRT